MHQAQIQAAEEQQPVEQRADLDFARPIVLRGRNGVRTYSRSILNTEMGEAQRCGSDSAFASCQQE